MNDMEIHDLMKSRLAAIVDSSEDAIIGKNLDGIITSWNKGAESLFGYSAEDMIGRHISVLATPDKVLEMVTILESIKAGKRIEHFETKRRTKSGKIIEISLTVSPIKDSNGNIIGASKIARDITQIVQTRNQLEALTKELEHRSKNLLAIISAIIRLTKANSVEEFKRLIDERITSISLVHSKISNSNWKGAILEDIIMDQINLCHNKNSKIKLTGTKIVLDPIASQAFGIALHELFTNVNKYGSLSVPTGNLEISWGYVAGGSLSITWQELNGPFVQEVPNAKSFGIYIIQHCLDSLFESECVIEWLPTGLKCVFVIPAKHLVT